tara:strand:- start:380 stop:673 length:294 start_codon:yes stop_codon:yes gene_type:complete
MNEQMIVTVVVSVLAALTSTKAWDFYKHKIQLSAERQKLEQKQDHLYRDDLRKEVQYLRRALSVAQEKITELSQNLAEMTVRVEFLEKENDQLKQGA